MQLTTMNLSFGTGISHSIDIPLTCPYCGKAVEFSPREYNTYDFNSSEIFHVYSLYSKCCGKISIASYLSTLNEDNERTYSFLSMYPNPKITIIPDNIKKLSPRFYSLFNDSEYAFSNNMFELAGSGYRNSLEILIKDYAINELKEDPNTVSKKSLYNAIEEYLPDKKLKNSADVVRILGNDFTHYEQKYAEFDLNILKAYLEIFIARINVEYMMSHPPVSRN